MTHHTFAAHFLTPPSHPSLVASLTLPTLWLFVLSVYLRHRPDLMRGSPKSGLSLAQCRPIFGRSRPKLGPTLGRCGQSLYGLHQVWPSWPSVGRLRPKQFGPSSGWLEHNIQGTRVRPNSHRFAHMLGVSNTFGCRPSLSRFRCASRASVRRFNGKARWCIHNACEAAPLHLKR